MFSPQTKETLSRTVKRKIPRWGWPFLLIVGIGLIAYANTFSVPFYFDDLSCIVENPVVHDLSNLRHLGDYWQLGIAEDIRNNIVTRFVTYLTFAANYKLHGLEVGGYHLVNLLLHLANALLFYHLVRLTRNSVPVQADQSDNLALIVALLFVAHPIQTTAVTYILQRFAVLATFFVLVTLCTYVLSVRASAPGWRKGWYAVALIATVLAMYTKEIAFTLPLLVALFDWTFLPGELRQRLRRLAPFFATMLLLPLTVMTLASVSEVTSQSSTNALDLVNLGHGSRWSYLFSQWPVIITYLRLLLFPAGLRLEYDVPRYTSLFEPAVLTSGLLLTTLLSLGLWLLYRSRVDTAAAASRRTIGFGVVWFFITLAMESSFIPLDDLLFEYRLYLPSCGFILALTAGADLLRQRLVLQAELVKITVACLILVLTTATILRNRTWQDEIVFWQDNVSKSPNPARPRCNLAYLYREQGDLSRAIAELEIAGRLNPDYWPPFEMLGDLRWNVGLYTQAAKDYEEALRRGNRSRGLLLKLGRAQRRSGNPEGARAALTAILAINPNDAEVLAELRDIPR
ncbi:MAG: tetratricopeptide repeat protein [Desulfuromonadales bacterium]|nr:tetratricopeptide repeat protein [Desulfuromonadales bacterium]